MSLPHTLISIPRNVILAVLLFMSMPSSSESIGYIKHATGKVQLYKADEFKPQTLDLAKLPVSLSPGDKVRSKANSDAVITLQDGSTVLLTSRSIIIFHQTKDHFIEGGKVLYDVRKQGGASGLIVATKSATIGVKGTQFMVKSNDAQQSIYLKKGLITVDANDDGFKRSLADELSQFERYSQTQKNGFEDYKSKLEKEYIEYVKSISMSAGQAINISNDNTLTEIEFTKQDESDFYKLDALRQH